MSWLDQRGIGFGAVTSIRPLRGGTQNLLLRLTSQDRDYVLRCARPGAGNMGNVTMEREVRVLGALAGTSVRHPRLVAWERSTNVLGRPFFLMEYIPGVSVAQEPPNEQQASALAPAVVDALLELHGLDLEAVGIMDFGRPEGFLERQPGRWQRQLEDYSQLGEYPQGDLPHVAAIVEWLEVNRPPQQCPGLLHGDVHLGNVIIDPVGRVAALVDWELCTVGDPLLDLGQLLVTWPDTSGSSLVGRVGSPGVRGLATEAEVLSHYRSRTSRDTSNIVWYTVLAGFRLGVLLEGSYARALAGRAPLDVGLELHAAASRLLADAYTRLSVAT